MLTLENIHARYDAITALRGISIRVRENELVALVGVNGAGKSTTLATIAGILKPVQGKITFNGEELIGRSPEYITRKGIAMVPESRDIFGSLTVAENLRLGGYTQKNKLAYARDLEEVLSLFSILKERYNQLGGTLSGGEQQQLAIARAMMSHPKLLMLDEPSLGLAPALVDQIFELISTLHNRGVTILLVEQNVERTLAIVDRAYLLNTGQVEVEGSASDIKEHVDIESVYLGTHKR